MVTCISPHFTDELLSNDSPHSEIIDACQEYIDNEELTEVDMTVLIWKSIMDAVEWNKKEDLLTDQALRHLHVSYCWCGSLLFVCVCTVEFT